MIVRLKKVKRDSLKYIQVCRVIANPAEPVNGQDERRICAAVDSPAPPLLVGNQGATARSATAPHYYSERGIFHDRPDSLSRIYPAQVQRLLQDCYPLCRLGQDFELKRQWERQVSLDYLMNEKFVQFCRVGAGRGIPIYRLRSDRPALQRRLADAISVCRSRRGRNPALLLSAPAAARDRRVYWPVTQHSGAAYPACLAAATRRNGGEPV